MRRIVGIIIFAIGLLMLLGSILLKVQDIRELSIGTLVSGAVIFGLSFIPRPNPGPDAPPPLPPTESIARAFYEPESLFKNLRYHPHWLAPFLIIALASGIYVVGYTQRLGAVKMASDVVERRIAGGFIPEDQIDSYRMQSAAKAVREGLLPKITAPLTDIILRFIFMLFVAGLLLLSVLAFGGRMNFWQALSVGVYSALPPVVIERLLSLVLLYIKSPDEMETLRVHKGLARADLGLLFSATEMGQPYLYIHPYLYAAGSLIGIFSLYRWWLTATGLRNTGEKISKGSAWAIVLMLWFLGVIVSLVVPLLVPSLVA
ncbi:MAG: YIP1 family protein [Acidobacteria bacterium]|nr:YIP1 family protein [Acidobacteriota bacterium]